MMSQGSIRALAKRCAYGSGLLGAWHRLRNSRSLTVAMFHRVLPDHHAAWSYSDSAWVVSEAAFRECLRFFRQHYSVIALEDLFNGAQLPRRPLLITFDDGWSDTAEYALPILREERLRATVFVVSDAVGRHEMWQQSVIRAHRQKRLSLSSSQSGGDPLQPVWKLIGDLNHLDSATRSARLRDMLPDSGTPLKPEMISADGLRALRTGGIDVGSHGVTHTPIPESVDAMRELRCSRAALAIMLDDASHVGLETFAFPRGLYDDRSIALAAEAGYRFLFTSDAWLNVDSGGQAAPAVLGRINIPSEIITDAAGRFRPEALACWLFLRSHR
jgi:peptidoglycan/xylan/chitin deacetylase (PgdA/CDA1 family)